MAVAVGSYTIVDMNDAISLSGYITSNLSKYQVINPDNGEYSPNWASTNLVLTPELYVTSETSNVITSSNVQSVKWYQDSSTSAITTGGNYVLSGAKNHILTIKNNLLSSASSIKFTCEIDYKDPTTGLVLKHKQNIEFIKVASGGGIVDALIETPNGNVFKNSSIASLTAQCNLWRGSSKDTTNVAYEWYMRNSSITTDQGGGIGWEKLTNTANKYTGVATDTLTIYPDAVPSLQTFKCMIKDTDSTSASYNQKFSGICTIIDMSDSIQVTVVSSGGDIFQNGVGSTVLTARLFQGGQEVDTDGTNYTYKWYKYDKNGTLSQNFGGTGVAYKSGKTLNVGSSDVDEKAQFQVEIE